MWISDWWNRVLAKFRKEENDSDPEPVMELQPEEAPEPVPERKTSDEMIIQMAESTIEEHNGTGDDTDPDAEKREIMDEFPEGDGEKAMEEAAQEAAEETAEEDGAFDYEEDACED